MEKIKKIANNFMFCGEIIKVEENNQGNINKTYIITCNNNDKEKKYLIQKINANVFKEPYLVMKNIELVTEHIKKKLEEYGDNVHKTLSIIKTKDNENLYIYVNSDGEKEYYRAFDYIDNCISYDSLNESNNPLELAYEIGKSFGLFQRLLNDFPTNMLGETIKDFHNVKKRFNDLLLSIENKVTNRAFKYSNEIIDLINNKKLFRCSPVHFPALNK